MNIFDPKGPVAYGNSTILVDSVVIMLAIVLPTIIAILAFAFWFRDGNKRATYRPDFAYSGKIELVVWSIPLLTIMLLGGVTWIGAHKLDPATPVKGTGSPIRIQVVSLDWKWLFIYPDQRIATINSITVPVGASLQFELTSASVMNAFFIPQLGSMIYTMNGMVTRLNLRADAEGNLQGLSSHFSGDGFPDMMFDVHIVSPLAFPEWVQATAKSDRVLDADSYKQLFKQTTESGRPTYRLGDPLLFDAISTQKIPPQPGPVPSKEAAPPYLQANFGANAICSASSTGRPYQLINLSR